MDVLKIVIANEYEDRSQISLGIKDSSLSSVNKGVENFLSPRVHLIHLIVGFEHGFLISMHVYFC